MIPTNNKKLVKRIAALAHQNQELEEKIRNLLKQNEILTAELEKLKSSPPEISGETVSQVRFNMVTVLFAVISLKHTGRGDTDTFVVMDELDSIFIEFGSIASEFNLEKISTIGDTIMFAGGIPVKNITNPVDVVMAALKISTFLERFESMKRGEERIWELKTGIHTGPVIAMVSGKKKASYRLKGDTVNNASRLCSLPGAGSIHISVMTYELIKEFFTGEYIGELPVKYKGGLPVYRVSGIKPGLSEGGLGKEPNSAFGIRFRLIQFTDLQEMILDKLEKELPSFVYYHNVKHTVDVVTEVELIGWAEGCNDEEILQLKAAALFHDTGITVSFDEHEYHGTVYARKVLSGLGYIDDHIDRICSVIMATKLPPSPKNLLEEIICDSDLDYLGRSDFIPVSNSLFEELKAQKKMTDLNEWNKLQFRFISGHQYFTKTARRLREVNKQLQIERIKSLIKD